MSSRALQTAQHVVQAKPGAPAGADEYNAFFYTLVSTDTQVLRCLKVARF